MTGIQELGFNVLPGICKVHWSEEAFNVHTLKDCSVCREPQLVPEFCLTGQNQRHRVL